MMAWLTGLLGAIVGTAITAGVSLYIFRKSRLRKRVDCAIGDPTPLFSISETIKEKLKITFDGQPVSSVFLFPLEVVNSGSVAIRSQPVLIRLAEGSNIVDYRIETEPQIGFGEIVCTKKEGSSLDLRISLLNPRDRVKMEILAINNPSGDINIGLKNEDVESRVFTRKSVESVLAGLPKDYKLSALAFVSAMPFFGSFAQTLATLEIAQRIDRISRKLPK